MARTHSNLRRIGMTLLITMLVWVAASWLVPRVGRAGYCRSWWGKESRAMRSLWMCTCGEGFEQSLYPKGVTVLVSACVVPQGMLTGDGYLFIHEEISSNSYILNGSTGERVEYALPEDLFLEPVFLTHDLVIYRESVDKGSEVHQISSGRTVPLVSVLEDEIFSPDGSLIRDKEYILSEDKVVFELYPINSEIVILDRELSSDSVAIVVKRQHVRENAIDYSKLGLTYIRVPSRYNAYYDDLWTTRSPDGRYEARKRRGDLTIYNASTNEPFIDISFIGRFAEPLYWIADDTFITHTTYPLDYEVHHIFAFRRETRAISLAFLSAGVPQQVPIMSQPVLRVNLKEYGGE